MSIPFSIISGARGEPFNINNVPNKAVWFDASDATTITIGDGPSFYVMEWANKGTLGGSALSDAMTITQGSLNSLTTVSFPVANFLEIPLALDFQERSVFFVYSMADRTEPTTARVFGGAGVSDFNSFIQYEADDHVYALVRQGGTRELSFVPDTPNTAEVLAGVHVSGGNVATQSGKGMALAASTTPAGFTTTETTYTLSSGSSSAWMLAEFLCISEGVTAEVRQQIEGYLAWKWEIQTQLPVGHPYVSEAP